MTRALGMSDRRFQAMFPTEGKVCEDCGNADDLVRHHQDEDIRNNTVDNIVILCRGCHTSRHHRGKVYSSETRAKIAAGARGNQKWLGKRHADHSRQKMSQSQRKAAPQRERDEGGRWK